MTFQNAADLIESLRRGETVSIGSVGELKLARTVKARAGNGHRGLPLEYYLREHIYFKPADELSALYKEFDFKRQ
jgi:hypothetical protein